MISMQAAIDVNEPREKRKSLNKEPRERRLPVDPLVNCLFRQTPTLCMASLTLGASSHPSIPKAPVRPSTRDGQLRMADFNVGTYMVNGAGVRRWFEREEHNVSDGWHFGGPKC
jgi:hypothetical protein